MKDLVIETNLSKTTDVQETLKWKVATLEEAKEPIQKRLTDYIGLAVKEVKSEQAYLKEAIKEIKARLKYFEEKEKTILEDGASFLIDYGITRMDGNIISSITIAEGKKAGTGKKFVRDCTTKEAEELLFNLGEGHYEDVEVPATKDKIKVNKRKTGTATIEE